MNPKHLSISCMLLISLTGCNSDSGAHQEPTELDEMTQDASDSGEDQAADRPDLETETAMDTLEPDPDMEENEEDLDADDTTDLPDSSDMQDSVEDEVADSVEIAELPDEPSEVDVPIDPTILGTLSVNCDLVANNAYVLDSSQIASMIYMALHFGDLVQEFGITGTVGGVNIADEVAYPERMYFGCHPPEDNMLRLMQVSMLSSMQGMAPQWTVMVDFYPDSSVTAGSSWPLGIDIGQATAVLLDSTRNNCLYAIGYGGSLTFDYAAGVTQIEGGQFTVRGTMEMADPNEIPDLCAEFESFMPCCP